jgi:hypothetical protein
MPASFKALSRRLRDRVLGSDEPLKTFLDQEATWFEEIGDVRDDICHRTAYDKARTATFPGLADVLRAGGSVVPFLSGADLRTYIGGVFRRTLALSCLAEAFVYQQIQDQHQQRKPIPPAIVVAEGEIDFTVSTKEPLFPLGAVIMTVDRQSLENLEYFLSWHG